MVISKKGMLCSVLLLGVFLGLLSLTVSACNSPQTTDTWQPNFVIILTDDQGYNTMDYMPILQRELVQKGINFTQGFVTTPLCCPSRASIHSGQFAHNHGVLDNRLPLGGALRFDDSSTLAFWLQQAGYRTALMGKYLNEYDDLEPEGYIPPGWDEWFVFSTATRPHRFYLDYDLVENGTIVHYGTDEKDFSTDVLAQRAVEFIKSSKGQPFFLLYAPYTPHQPHEFAKRHSQMYRDDQEIMDILPPNFNEEDISDKAEWLRGLGPTDREQAISVYQRTLRSLQAVDEAIGGIIKALEQTRQRDNTVVIVLSDNGLTYGEHRLTGQKNCQFEECIRVPFVVSYPAMIQGPREDTHLVLNIDLAPTLAEMAGIAIPDTVDGASLVPLLEGNSVGWRDAVLFEHWRLAEGFGGAIPDFSGIRTANWKYLEYDTGEIELYDLENDPYEMQNLAYVEAYSTIMADLATRLEELRAATGYDPGLREKIMKESIPEGYTGDSNLPNE